MRREDCDPRGFGCEVREFNFGCAKLETSVKHLSWDVECEGGRVNSELEVGQAGHAEMKVIGVQTTSKSRRWEDTAKELSQDTEENSYVKTLEKRIVLHSVWEPAFW